MLVSEFMRNFYKKLYEVAPEEVHRDLTKQERAVKHVLYMVMGDKNRLTYKEASYYQERFHVRIDQLASDYRTWKRAGCKAYARPKQYVSGKVAGASKKAFDYVLGTFLIHARNQVSELERIKEEEGVLIDRDIDSQDPLADFNPL